MKTNFKIKFYLPWPPGGSSLPLLAHIEINVNTGLNNGAIRLLELYVGHPVQWLVCMYHFNELPLRHLVLNLDGTTSGPTAFNGNIGKALVKCHELSLVKFESRQNNLPNVLQDLTGIDISKD